jgi:hypothetical protein
MARSLLEGSAVTGAPRCLPWRRRYLVRVCAGVVVFMDVHQIIRRVQLALRVSVIAVLANAP